MDWNIVITFVLSSAGITLLTLLYRVAYKSGRQDQKIEYIDERMRTNEVKSISSTKENSSDITRQEILLNKLLDGQSSMQSSLNDIKTKLDEHEILLNKHDKILDEITQQKKIYNNEGKEINI